MRHWAFNSFDSPLDVSRVDVGHEVRIGSWMNILDAAYSEVHTFHICDVIDAW
jgi:hypothetical protein